jgi:hypothetical protein
MVLNYDDLVKSLKTVTPAEAGVQNYLNLLDSRSPLLWGQVYPCESRGGNDKIGEITTFYETLIYVTLAFEFSLKFKFGYLDLIIL